MAYLFQWHIPERVYICRIVGDLTEDDITGAVDAAFAYVRSGQPPVHVLADVRELGKRPNNISKLRDVLAFFREPNLGMTCLIHTDKMTNFIATTMAQISRTELKAFSDPAKAIVTLQQLDTSLPEIPPYPSEFSSS